MASGSDPLVVGLSGDLTAGKEVSKGAGAQPMLLTAPGRERGEADLPRRIPDAPEPVVLLGVRGLLPSMGPAFEGAAPLDDLPRAHSAATLRLVRADGPLDLTPPRAWMPPSPRPSSASGRGPGLAIRFRFPRTS